MAEERNVGLERAADTTAAEADPTDATKVELQRRMEEARESISQTVSEIKETVVTQYQQVRESISDSLDWREQYRRRPVEFSVGALGVGLVVGYAVGGAIVGRGGDDYDEDDESYYDAGESLSDVRTAGGPSPVGRSYESGAAGASRASSVASPQMFAAAAEHDAGGSRAMQSSHYADSAGASEPSGPGLMERFRETRAYDRLQQELSTLGDRAVEELSKTAQAVVLPAILGKLKDLVGIDLSTQREVAQRSQLEHQAAKASAATASATDAGGPAGTPRG
ncbi:MAG TPA: hypothetical protein VER32_12260 [Pyrinomonadaceae bacterium]|nr:hypothetical protein [Pyrinomonadaceae bacterium]